MATGLTGAEVAVGSGGVVAVGAGAGGSVAAGTAVAAGAGGWVAAGAGAAVAAGWQALKNMLAMISIVTTTKIERCFTFSSFKEYAVI